jgi:hypothetical protein
MTTLEILTEVEGLLPPPLALAVNLARAWISWRRHRRMLTPPHSLERLEGKVEASADSPPWYRGTD